MHHGLLVRECCILRRCHGICCSFRREGDGDGDVHAQKGPVVQQTCQREQRARVSVCLSVCVCVCLCVSVRLCAVNNTKMGMGRVRELAKCKSNGNGVALPLHITGRWQQA